MSAVTLVAGAVGWGLVVVGLRERAVRAETEATLRAEQARQHAREEIAREMSAADDIDVVAEAADGADVRALVDEYRPDLVLMDIRMPRMDGLAATAALRELPRPPQVLILTTFTADSYVLQALRAGAAGHVLKHMPPAQIVAAVRNVMAGEPVLSSAAVRQLIDTVTDPGGVPGTSRHEEREKAEAMLDRLGAPEAGGRPLRRRGQNERGDRHGLPHEPAHGEGPRLPHPDRTRSQQPRTDRAVGLPRGPRLSVPLRGRWWRAAGAVVKPREWPSGRETGRRTATGPGRAPDQGAAPVRSTFGTEHARGGNRHVSGGSRRSAGHLCGVA